MPTKKKILIIEDERPMLEILTKKLGAAGYEILQAEDGVAGVELATKNHPDLILLDIILPGIDGMVVLNKLRDDVWGKNADVIILTNLSDSKRISEAMDLGVYQYLVKSDLDINQIIERIKAHVGQ